MIDIRNLTKKYGDFTAVDDISLTAVRGEIYGFLVLTAPGRRPPSASSPASPSRRAGP